MSISRTPARVFAALMVAGAVATVIPQAATTSYAAPKPQASVSASASTLKVWTSGHYVKGADLDVYAYPGNNSHGIAYRTATVVGPHGIRATLTPAADAGYLQGTIHVPAALKGSWMRLTLINPAGARASVIVTKAPAPVVHRKAATPVKLWASSGYGRDGMVDLNAYPGNDRHGVAYRSATVVGPAGMRTTLSPAADAGYLVGEVQVPKALRGKTITLTLVTPAGVRTSIQVKPAA